MQFRTEFPVQQIGSKITYSSLLLLTGSCFSEYIGEKLSGFKFRTLCNPSGILYNPDSLAGELSRIIENKHVSSDELFFSDGVYRHFDFHSRVAHPDLHVATELINRSVETAHQFLESATHIIITFGTAFVYGLRTTGKVVANNHKLPADQFEKRRLSVPEISDQWKQIIERLFHFNQRINILFTVSPVRHIKDGMVENQLSKSVLITAVHELTKMFPAVTYFPAYELMMDDLRDYRFYNRDMVHPNDLAVEYIFEKFKTACIDSGVHELMAEIKAIVTAMQHKPFFPGTEEHKLFKEQMLAKVKELQSHHQEVNLGDEIRYFND